MMLLDSELHFLKSATNNSTDISLILSPNMTGTNETNFSHNLLFTNRQVSSPCKAFANNSFWLM